MRKMLWSKLKLSFSKEGRRRKEEDMNSLTSKSNVSEEYKEAFRTKSYIEMCSKVQGQLEIRTDVDGGQSVSSSSSSSSSSPSSHSIQYVHLSEYLFEPHQETLTSIPDSSNLHQFLANYFEISLEACTICESLLTNIHQVRNDHRAIKNVITLIQRVPDTANWTHDQHHAVYKNLASFALRRNPFSTMSPQKFHELHDSHLILLHELTSQCRKTKRRTQLIRLIKRAMASFLVMGCGALAIALLVLAMHCMVGLVAAPGLVIWSLGHFMKRKCNETWLEGLVAKLDIAARGVYIMINDFATMSRIVKRLHNEMEHRKFVAEICVRKGKNEMLKEVVKEFQMYESCFLEQLEELEKQIYLCFLDIYRSRRLLVREMV
ncbi:hypothetical protein Pfo_017089 [Paulownia fortunei]|nr:hypothetical protein Pfo_017089 [Paulownia fortunei]